MSQSDEAWNDVGDQFKKLGSTFKQFYQVHESSEGVDPPSEDDVRDALRTLGDSVRQAFATVGDAFNDPEIKEETRYTAGLFFDALGATFSGLGDDISNRGEDAQEPPSSEQAQRSTDPEGQDLN
ncbi:MAG: hypothetical protein M3132_12620 [Actinomycetia bacterium]|nr:hypothetical protein [Actinomycetes bacterium]